MVRCIALRQHGSWMGFASILINHIRLHNSTPIDRCKIKKGFHQKVWTVAGHFRKNGVGEEHISRLGN
jgi:hypothetical protein